MLRNTADARILAEQQNKFPYGKFRKATRSCSSS